MKKILNMHIDIKKWILIYIAIIPNTCILFIILFNYYIDPFGLRSTKDKLDENLASILSYIYHSRIQAKAPYYVIGASQGNFIDYNVVSNYLNKHVIKLGINGSIILEHAYLIEKIKNSNSNFILGFNASSINKNNSRYAYKLKNTDYIDDDSFLDMHLDLKTLQESLKTIFKKNTFFSEINKLHKHIVFSNIEKDFIGNKSYYINYEPDYDTIQKIIKMTNNNDIFIIYPKPFYYYKLFQKYNIEQKYFDAIKMIVKNTDAKVWSFYGVNQITLDDINFDGGTHFKPKISNLIFARIFDDKNISVPDDFGVLLTKENVDEYFDNIHKQIKNFNHF